MKRALTLALTLAPAAAEACPACAGNRDNQVMYLVATALMLALPVALVGGFALWLRRCAREADAGAQ